jgi:hypothetical protein
VHGTHALGFQAQGAAAGGNAAGAIARTEAGQRELPQVVMEEQQRFLADQFSSGTR